MYAQWVADTIRPISSLITFLRQILSPTKTAGYSKRGLTRPSEEKREEQGKYEIMCVSTDDARNIPLETRKSDKKVARDQGKHFHGVCIEEYEQ